MAVFKLPKPRRLPSGSYRVQFQIEGKRYSVVRDDPEKAKEDADKLARDILSGIEIDKKTDLTVDKAIEKYIEAKKGTLSPSTIKGYTAYRKNYLQTIKDMKLSELTQSDIQTAVSVDAINGKSPKTIRNAHGLLSAVLDVYRPNMHLNTRLPQKKKFEIRVFTEDEMKKVWKAAKGSNYELPILLASWLGLRMSEVRGLQFGDVKDNRLHVQRAIVDSVNGDVVKGTKTTSGDRWIKLPEDIKLMIESLAEGKKPEDYICPYADITIYKNFIKICEKAGVEPCRFHDLRHFAASEAHALGVPDKYLIQRMGHKTDNMLKNVYQHTMRDKEDEFADLIDNKMSSLYNFENSAHKNAHGS